MERIGKILRAELVKDIKQGIGNNKSVFLLGFSALSSSDMDSLRKDLRRSGMHLYVSKNRISKIALKEFNQEKLLENVNSQTAFAWGNADSAEISKILIKFSKNREAFLIHGGILDGALLNKEQVKRLASLPSKDVLRAQLLQMMLSPLTRFAGALNAKSRDLLSILKQLSEKKGGK